MVYHATAAGPPRSEPSTPGGAGSLSCSGPAPEDIHGPVGAPLLDCQRGVVPKTRALSHYPGDTYSEKADHSNLNRSPGGVPVYRPGLRKKPGRDPGLYAPQPPAIPIAPLQGRVKIPRLHRERDRMAPVSRAAGPRQFPLRPYRRGRNVLQYVEAVPDAWAHRAPASEKCYARGRPRRSRKTPGRGYI